VGSKREAPRPWVYVVDASAIPTIPRANTNLTAIALAERAADWL
jgi:choline dehydrogenase-like flavoprotein